MSLLFMPLRWGRFDKLKLNIPPQVNKAASRRFSLIYPTVSVQLLQIQRVTKLSALSNLPLFHRPITPSQYRNITIYGQHYLFWAGTRPAPTCIFIELFYHSTIPMHCSSLSFKIIINQRRIVRGFFVFSSVFGRYSD